MGTLIYLKGLQLKNSIKSLKNEKSKLVFVIIIAFFLGLSMIPAFLNNEKLVPVQDGERSLTIFFAFVYSLICLFTLRSLWAGTQKASLLYRTADIQFIFTSPIKPQTVLMYGMLNRLLLILLGSFFLVFQYNSVRYAGVGLDKFLICILLFFVSSFAGSSLSMIIYTLTYESERRKKFMQVLIVAAILLLLTVLLKTYADMGDMLATVKAALKNPVIRYFPIVGWSIEIMRGLILGFTLSSAICAVLLFALIFLSLQKLYMTNINFYEDAIDAIGTYEKALENKKKGKTNINFKTSKAGNFGIGKGFGESAIMYRILKSTKREISNFASSSTIAMFIGGGCVLAVIKISGMPQELSMMICTFVLLYILVIYAQYSSFIDELKSDLFFTMPGNNLKKLVYASLPIIIKTAGELFVLLAICTSVLKCSIGEGIGAYISLIGFSFALIGGELICFRVLHTDSGTLFSLLSLLIDFLIILPGIAVTSIMYSVKDLVFFDFFSLPGAVITILGFLINIAIYLLCLKVGENLLRFGRDA